MSRRKNLAKQHTVTLDFNAPFSEDDKSPKAVGVFLMIFSLFWGGIPTGILIKELLSGTMTLEKSPLLLFTVLGTGLFCGGLYMLTHKRTTSFDGNMIKVVSKSLFGRKEWSEPLKSYEGVLARSEYRSGGKNSPSYTLYKVELIHPNKDHKLLIWQNLSEDGWRAKWEAYCRELKLPAMEKDGDSYVKRQVEDLDKSISELAAEGKLKVNFDPASTPPKPLQVQSHDDGIEIAIKKGQVHPLFWLVMLILPGAFIYVGFFAPSNDGFTIIFGIIGILVLIGMIAGAVWEIISTRIVRLTAEEIHILRKSPFGDTKGKLISAQSIESVRIDKSQKNQMKCVLISTDHGQYEIGAMLKDNALEWIKGYILWMYAPC